jgi:hypothetical protein
MTAAPGRPGDDDLQRPPLPSWQPPAAARDAASDPQLRAMALKRLEDQKAFRIHLTVYAAVMGLLVAIWLMSGAGYFWPVWPAMGWGLAVVLHRASMSWDKEPTEEEIAEQARRILQRRGTTGSPAADPRRLEGPQDTV